MDHRSAVRLTQAACYRVPALWHRLLTRSAPDILNGTLDEDSKFSRDPQGERADCDPRNDSCATPYFRTYVRTTYRNTSSPVSRTRSFLWSLRRPDTNSGVAPSVFRRSNSTREQTAWAVS